MAKSQPQPFLLMTFLAAAALTFSAVSAARPCKTLVISSYSMSLRRIPQPGVRYVTVLTEITQSRPLIIIDGDAAASATTLPSSSWPYDLSSLRDRTKDILSVVVALLFGVGCGVLTAATMYLAWSLFSAPRPGTVDDYYDCSSDDDDQFSPKKIGYVNIPAATEDHGSAEKAAAV